ncbi:MAG: GDSL-type esterase/lipase family protein [Opitutaceae bacterium]|jgi:acyl-CoA thioesterase-1|nr:GDSL-type esterase/lipase family protein [Opitutaceae bacterium]
MKTSRILPLACLLAAWVANTVTASQLVDNLKAGKNQTVVVFGTSLTAGDGAKNGWVKSLDTWLDTLDPDGAAKATVINSGQSGKASRTGLSLLQSAVIAQNPDTVFIEFSMNDAYRGPSYAATNTDYRICLQESKNNLKSMITQIRAALPDTEIIIQTMNCIYDPDPGAANPPATGRPQIAEFYQGYRDVYAELKSTVANLILIDHEPTWLALRANDEALYKSYVTDGLHPTAAGTNAVTFPAIQAALTASAIPEPATSATLAGGFFLRVTPLGRAARRRW